MDEQTNKQAVCVYMIYRYTHTRPYTKFISHFIINITYIRQIPKSLENEKIRYLGNLDRQANKHTETQRQEKGSDLFRHRRRLMVSCNSREMMTDQVRPLVVTAGKLSQSVHRVYLGDLCSPSRRQLLLIASHRPHSAKIKLTPPKCATTMRQLTDRQHCVNNREVTTLFSCFHNCVRGTRINI